jgi:hypothetical protein
MRLNFNVLWVDDQPERVEAQIKAIAKGMEEHGFEFQPTLCHSLDEVRSRTANDVFNDEIDLVLVDWDLGRQVQGQDAIAEIRDHIQYKDVVFYSANKSADELRELAFKRKLEGVYCVTRVELVGEVIGVFESLIKKVLDLDHVRGIVMGATSDIDAMIHECLACMHELCDKAGRQLMLEEALRRIDERVGELTKLAEGLRQATGFKEILDAHLIFTANDRLRMLNKVLKQQIFKAHHKYRSAVTIYINDVVPKRNNLGHRVLTPEGRPIAVRETGRDVGAISIEDMRVLRCSILELRAEFRNFLGALKSPA